MSKKKKETDIFDVDRVIPIEEVRASDHYDDMAQLSEIFRHPIIEDAQGTWRWKANKLTCFILGRRSDPYASPCHNIDLNNLCVEWQNGKFSLEEYMKFQMDIGYSLCGFSEIFDQREDEATGLTLLELVISNHSKPENKGKNWLLVQTPWREKPWMDR